MIDAMTAADGLIVEMSRQGKSLDNLKLQKLLYFAEGVHFVFTGEPLVAESFEAWVHGPVIPRLYRRFKEYGWQPIGVEAVTGEGPTDEDAREAIEQVVAELGHLDGIELERRTHEQEPWTEARGDLAPDEPSNSRISKDTTHRYFAELFAA